MGLGGLKILNKRVTTVIAIIGLAVLLGCSKEELTSDLEIYFNDFESQNLEGITGGSIIDFNGSQVIGNYNYDGFRLHLNDLPKHKYIYISFELLLHDSWDGNTNDLEPEAPDLWVMDLNPDLNIQGVSEYKFETTFSNGPCDSQLCLYQSYPNIYPFLAKPKTGLSQFAPGLCHFANQNNGTSIMRIQKTYPHTDRALIVDFYDRLYQSNVFDPKCDESWSMDNLSVRVLTVK